MSIEAAPFSWFSRALLAVLTNKPLAPTRRILAGLDLAIVHRSRHPPASHHLQNAWRNGYRSTLRIVESTKNIAWKKRLLYFLLSVRPLPDRLVLRKKALKTLIF